MLGSVLRRTILKSARNKSVKKLRFDSKEIGLLSSVYHNCILTFTTKLAGNEAFFCSQNAKPATAENEAEENLKEKDVVKTDEVPNHPLFENINYAEIAGNDEETLKELKVLVGKMYLMHAEGSLLPDKLTLEMWHELLKLRSFAGRTKYLRYLFINERRRENDMIKKAKKKEMYQEFLRQREITSEEEKKDPTKIFYGLGRHAIFLRLNDHYMDKFHNFKLCQAMMYGPKMVIDCSYGDYMVNKEVGSCAKQLMYLFGLNRTHSNPVDFHFCNFDQESSLAKRLHKRIPVMYDNHFPFNWTSESYLDVFPPEKLVYLSPHCQDVLETVNHDDIYIIGAMVDKSISEPLSATKAKQAGVRTAKLPLDMYVEWGFGGKSLTVDQCAMIMVDMLTEHDWKKALKTWVPKRKLFKSTEDMMETMISRPTNARNLKLSFKRNMNLYDFVLKEEEGEKGKTVKARWPQ